MAARTRTEFRRRHNFRYKDGQMIESRVDVPTVAGNNPKSVQNALKKEEAR